MGSRNIRSLKRKEGLDPKEMVIPAVILFIVDVIDLFIGVRQPDD